MKPTVAIGLLGTTLDRASKKGDRWTAWRPSVAICQQEDFLVDRFELLYDTKSESLLHQVVEDIGAVSPETEVRPVPVRFRDPWDFEEVFGCLHDFANNYDFNVDQEDYLVHITTGTHVAQICLFLLTESRHLPGRLLQSSPPRRSNGPACGTVKTIDLDLSKYDALATRFQREQERSALMLKGGIATRNSTFNALIEQVERVCLLTRAPILLTGPTGAGKSQLARRIFALKQHRNLVEGQLVEVNCATLRGDQAMSTLFGHTKGAYTGATENRAGLLKSADRGVLFLDEIGELGTDEQAMLLKAAEEKSFTPVGSDTPVHSDFQLIAGTNQDLRKSVAEGVFRDDLLARINLWEFKLPSLAERREDIDPNIDFELARFSEDEKRKVTMNREAREQFLAYATSPSAHWPGNFRDFNSSMTRMATLATTGRITREDVREEIRRLKQQAAQFPTFSSAGLGSDAALEGAKQVLQQVFSEERVEALDRFDILQLADALNVCRQSKSLSEAGRKLFANSRLAKRNPNDADRLRKYLAKFGLSWKEIQP